MTQKNMNSRKFSWSEIVRSLSHLIYPETCLICDEELPINNSITCSFCQKELHYTFFEKYTEPTVLDALFWGRIPLDATYSLLFFEKEKSTQKILHALKYQSKPEVGVEFGKEIGRKIKPLTKFKDLDLIVPVPIHPRKEFERGYNQSEQIAYGISTILSVKMDTQFLKKQSHTGSQTKKGRFARWDNVQDNFILNKHVKSPKHVALVDDVITTGATIEALARAIQENYPEIRISIISLAVAK